MASATLTKATKAQKTASINVYVTEDVKSKAESLLGSLS